METIYFLKKKCLKAVVQLCKVQSKETGGKAGRFYFFSVEPLKIEKVNMVEAKLEKHLGKFS